MEKWDKKKKDKSIRGWELRNFELEYRDQGWDFISITIKYRYR